MSREPFGSMTDAPEPKRLKSRQWSCSSLMSALQKMDAPSFIDAIPDDPADLAAFIQDVDASAYCRYRTCTC